MIGDLLVTLYIGNSVKDLEQEVDIPTGETLLWWKLCVPWEHHCILCSTVLYWGRVLGGTGTVQDAHAQCSPSESRKLCRYW